VRLGITPKILERVQNYVLVYTGGTGMGQDEGAIITADSLQQAAESPRGCPIVTGGDSVEVYETFPVL